MAYLEGDYLLLILYIIEGFFFLLNEFNLVVVGYYIYYINAIEITKI